MLPETTAVRPGARTELERAIATALEPGYRTASSLAAALGTDFRRVLDALYRLWDAGVVWRDVPDQGDGINQSLAYWGLV